jgi:hypothetical protein
MASTSVMVRSFRRLRRKPKSTLSSTDEREEEGKLIERTGPDDAARENSLGVKDLALTTSSALIAWPALAGERCAHGS